MIENIEEKQLETKQDSEDPVDSDKANEIIKNDPIHEKENDNPDYKKIVIPKIVENIPNADTFYTRIEKDKKDKLNPRIPGIFILFDNINFYFNQFQKFRFFSNYETSIPKSVNEIEDINKIFAEIEDYVKEQTSIELLLDSKKINFDDIISDYVLYFINKQKKLTKDSCDIKHIYIILMNLIKIKKMKEELEDYKYFANIIILFNCFSSYITYPLYAIKFLNDEKIIENIYTKILKEIEQYKNESNIILIILEAFFNILINEILKNEEIIPELEYIHLFLMNIINILNLQVKSFYTYMQFKSLYKIIGYFDAELKDFYSKIYKIKDIFIDPNKKEEALKSYLNFYEELRKAYDNCNNGKNEDELRHFIIEYFTYELKKYHENEELFPIIIDIMIENEGKAFIQSNKIFQIFLKKYMFEMPPKNEEECRNILSNAFSINKDNKEDLFLKKYNEIINNKGNEKIKIMMDEIIQQVFGFYLNAYFMSYLDKINDTNSYECNFDDSIFDDNKLFLKICIEFLENIEKPYKGKEISIFLANAFIQSFLYVFVKYFYKNINDKKEYKGEYNLNNIFEIVKGKSRFRRVVQIYIIRLINSFIDDKSFEKFKEFKVENDDYKSFIDDFLTEYSFDDPPYKLIFYCKKIYEDFFNNDEECLPIDYELKGYNFENNFPYNRNIIHVKMINNHEVSKNSLNSYENNSQFLSRLAILIVSNAAKDLINNDRQFKEINNEIML